MTQTAEPGQLAQYLSFDLAGAEYGVGILAVKEILQFETITPVPSVPRSVRGVINLRGSVVPVIDLAVKFGLPQSDNTRATCIVITEVQLEGHAVVMGIMTDAVDQVIELADTAIQPAPPFGTRVNVDYLLGMGSVAERLLLLLNVDKILATDEIVAAASLQDSLAAEAVA
jgi:purine-binding chemotaxis protein CheW